MPMGRYLYGVGECSKVVELGPIGIGDPPALVWTVPVKGISALVSAVQSEELLPSRRDVMAHQRVLEAAPAAWNVLPVSFGTVCTCEDELIGLMQEQHEVFAAALGRMRGLAEVGVKAFWSREELVGELCQRDASLAPLLQKQESSALKQADRDRLIEVGQRVEALVAEWREQFANEICRRLGALARDYKLTDPIGLKMLFNAAFLIERARVPAFEDVLHVIDKEYAPRLDFRYVRPMPPYNFVDLHLEPQAIRGGRA